MQCLKIEGGFPLQGEIPVHGAKNSALPLLAAAVLCREEVIFHNCPGLSDVAAACRILEQLGCRIRREGSTIAVDPSAIGNHWVPDHLMREMRSSVVFLGSVAARLGEASLCFPGGCELGARPIDLHLMGLRALGMEIIEQERHIYARVPNGLRGARIHLRFPSVGATENILLAAVLAEGETVIENAAREPEIGDLAAFLNCCGAKVQGAGSGTLTVEGVSRLHGCSYTVMPDRIEAATWLCCGASAGGEILVSGARPDHLESLLPLLERMGCRLRLDAAGIRLQAPERLSGCGEVVTSPYPGFPTDMQAVLMACACGAEGESSFEETIFENRFRHSAEFEKMGARIQVEGMKARVRGVRSLQGADVTATDLRGGAAMAALALRAEGATVIRDIRHIDRGYECLERDLSLLGASIRRVNEEEIKS